MKCRNKNCGHWMSEHRFYKEVSFKEMKKWEESVNFPEYMRTKEESKGTRYNIPDTTCIKCNCKEFVKI